MTTNIIVHSRNHPARVETRDNGKVVDTKILTPEDGAVTLYCTTTRELRITDLEYDDVEVVAARAAKAKDEK